MKAKRKPMLVLCFILAAALVCLILARNSAEADEQPTVETPAPAVQMPMTYIPVPSVDDECVQPEETEPDVPEEPEPLYAEEDLECLAIAIYCEAGSNGICDECRYRVGDVILNRVADDRFPDTIQGVLEQPRQYGMFGVTGVVWPERAQYEVEREAVERAYEVARQLLTDERHSDLYGQGYIWQAEFVQGSDGFWCDGTFFGR